MKDPKTDSRIRAMLKAAQSCRNDKWGIGGRIKEHQPPKVTLPKVTEMSTADAD